MNCIIGFHSHIFNFELHPKSQILMIYTKETFLQILYPFDPAVSEKKMLTYNAERDTASLTIPQMTLWTTGKQNFFYLLLIVFRYNYSFYFSFTPYAL